MTTRRSFFATLSAAVAGFAILPPATTYARIWKATRQPIINPDWHNAEYELSFRETGIGYNFGGVFQYRIAEHPLRFTFDESEQKFHFVPHPDL